MAKVRQYKKYMIPILILWMIVIYYLSSQNGTQTANTSGGIARAIASFLYSEPTYLEINHVHMFIRKSAHIVLYLIFGSLLSYCLQMILYRFSRAVQFGTSTALVVFYAFFDEWHKQFIAGRHNELQDVLLNVIGGLIGILIMYLVTVRREKRESQAFARVGTESE